MCWRGPLCSPSERSKVYWTTRDMCVIVGTKSAHVGKPIERDQEQKQYWQLTLGLCKTLIWQEKIPIFSYDNGLRQQIMSI